MLEQATGDGVDCSRTGPGKGKAAMLEPDRRGTGVAAMSQSCSLVDQSRKTEKNQEVRCNPEESISLRDAGTEQSEPGTGDEKAVFGLWTTHQEARQVTDSGV